MMQFAMSSTFKIVLATVNARYHHASFALRCLYSNLGPYQADASLLEFTSGDAPNDMAERILRCQPKILGLSVYIWNVELLTELVAILKALAPTLRVVLGGPEVSHELEGLKIAHLSDYIVQGEGEWAFQKLCERLLSENAAEVPKIIAGGLPTLSELFSPYDAYNEEDLRQRTLYVEASRGCPYRCEFCLSALDQQVRHFPIAELLQQFQRLIDRGARNFKFIDRTFNLQLELSAQILNFFLERHQPGMLFHFELVPDRLPEGLRSIISRFPAGSLQFEVGVQTLNETVGRLISRRQNLIKMEDNFKFLKEQTHAHVHADLIVGLPGESFESFGAGLDRLYAMGPQEIQVGILKKLRGAPIARHTEAWGMIYSETPPYEILQTNHIDFPTMQRLKRFAFVWDRLVNRGNLNHSAPLLWGKGGPFTPVMAFADSLYATLGQVHAISLDRLSECLALQLTTVHGLSETEVYGALTQDYAKSERLLPATLRGPAQPKASSTTDRHRQRQLKHQRHS